MKNKILENHLKENNLTVEEFAKQCNIEIMSMQKIANRDIKADAFDAGKVAFEIGVLLRDLMDIKENWLLPFWINCILHFVHGFF